MSYLKLREVAEWSKAHAWKVCIRQKRIEGSNPFLSAKLNFNLYNGAINFFRKTFIFLPLIYIGFSFVGEGNDSLFLEIIYGLPFIFFGIYFIKEKNSSLILIATLYFIHILYDFYNEGLTNNIGVIYPYREFCMIYDLLVGTFLLYCVYLNNKS